MEEFLLLLNLGISALVLVRSCRPTAESAPVTTPPTPQPEDRKAREMDQGVENILSYTVSLGRGKTTGGEAN